RTQGGGGMQAPSGSGRGESAEKPARKRFDPLAPARGADGVIVLDRLPKEIPPHMRKRLRDADVDGSGTLSRVEEETLYDEVFVPKEEEREEKPGREKNSSDSGRTGSAAPGGGRPGDRKVVIPEELVVELENDPQVRSVDRNRNLRAFIYGEKSESENSADEPPTAETGAAEESLPEGIDPSLHRRGLAAYRQLMGTPMAMGDVFCGTDAQEPPTELKEGRWFDPANPDAREAVLGEQAAQKYNAAVGDRLLVLTKTDEYQLKVVGILDDRRLTGFFVSSGAADKIANTPSEINSAAITLASTEKETEFVARWKERLEKEAPGAVLKTNADVRREEIERLSASSAFRLQSVTGTVLAILASLMIVQAALSIGVEGRRREIGLLRAVGAERRHIALSLLFESFLLAIPGWLGGLLAGWLILCVSSGKAFELNGSVVGFSFVCAVVGSVIAAVVPMANACRIRPLEAVSAAREIPSRQIRPAARRLIRYGLPAAAAILIGGDLFLIYGIHTSVTRRAALHSGIGVLALALGVLCLIPALVRLSEKILLPILASLLRFDGTVSANELSAHIKRTTAAAAMLAVGGGLFTMMQVWGYSMLGPFLPNTQMPDAFAAFLPVGLTGENVELVRTIPWIEPGAFEPVAVEQAAFAPESVPNGRGGEFANVVLFGMNVERAYAGSNPLVRLKFLQGDPDKAYAAMESGRGVVVNDALTIDYGFKLGDTLRLCDPKQNARILEYPIVGIVALNGWQWLSKTSGVRRNYGRSGGMVFASDRLVRDDYRLSETGYFWFNLKKGTDTKEVEAELDRIARKNLAETAAAEKEKEPNADTPRRGRRPALSASGEGNAAYAKLTTRQSLLESISKRADGVIWGLSTMPLVTLALMSIALVAVSVNSVHARRRTFGILRAVGVERGKLTRMILAEAILLALCGAIASLLFGIIAAVGALKLGESMFGTADPPLILPAKGLSAGLAFLIFLAAVAAAVPAVRIGRAKPLDLLK
ncbi:MAG: ABC transporter permease, partial [Thermoguttaceae bacterium]|nr:ABC transporter permease [Thermoguttaceae bacterium]